MDAETILLMLDRAGVFVFALSGGLAAVRHRMDIFGVVVIALLPAIGGGTLRDLLLGQPVFWLNDEVTLVLATLAGLLTFFAPRFLSRMKSLVWFDAVGLSLFSIVGASKAYELGYNGYVTVMMGAMTATAGGLIRDVVCNQIPMLLREQVYAIAAIAGACAYWLAMEYKLGSTESVLIGALLTFGIRSAGIIFGLSLPKAKSTPTD